MTYLIIALALCATLGLVAWLGGRSAGRPTPEPGSAGAEDRTGGPLHGERCLLCDAPVRRVATSDEVVRQLELRIDAERTAISQVLRQPDAELLDRVFKA